MTERNGTMSERDQVGDRGLPSLHPKVEFDGGSGAIYVQLREVEVARTVEVPTVGMGIMIQVDVDEDGKAIGVEII